MSFQDNTLSARALAALRSANPPHGNTGGISRHPVEAEAKTDVAEASKDSPVPQNAPRSSGVRRSRARGTTHAMQAFLDGWFFDWMSLTVPSPDTGKGTITGRAHADAATERLVRFAKSQRLHLGRIGGGGDGYPVGACFGMTPIDKSTVARVRYGHRTTMPGIEIPGGDGACHGLALAAFDLLGPTLVARADVSLDVSRPGLWDGLLAYAQAQTGAGAGRGMEPPRTMTSGCGRTFYWGKGEVSVRVYEKDLERVARGALEVADADPNLVRVEFVFRPKGDRKSGFHGMTPGAMIGTSRWARRMCETMARMIGATGDRDTMGETKVSRTPDARTVDERADHLIRQAARTLIHAAAADAVAAAGGDWDAVTVTPEDLTERAVARVAARLAGAAEHFVATSGLDAVRDEAERADHAWLELQAYLDRQNRLTAEARSRLAAILVGEGYGPSGPESSPGSSGGSSGGASGTACEAVSV